MALQRSGTETRAEMTCSQKNCFFLALFKQENLKSKQKLKTRIEQLKNPAKARVFFSCTFSLDFLLIFAFYRKFVFKMSNNNNTHPNPSSSANVPVLNQLLAVATQAQGDSPADQTHSFSQMPEEDRAWLEAALSHIAADSDPVKKLKRWMARLEEVGEPSEANLGDIGDILEEIGDLVCDIDMAQCFCSLNGISLIQRLLAKQFDPCSALLFHLVGVLAQYNQRVQQLLLHTTAFLSHCLDIIVDSERLVDYRHKCVGAISAMVKAHLPALIRFVELDGPDKLMRCFEDGVGMADNTKLAHRCVVAAVALKRSFSVEVVNIDSNFRRVVQCPAEMRAKLVETNGDTKWNDTLEFLAE